MLIGSLYSDVQSQIPGSEAAGRWDLTLQTPEGERASWLEIERSGVSALVGRFVGPGGSARPVSKITYSGLDNLYRFEIPPQWQQSNDYLKVEFSLENDKLKGWMVFPAGQKVKWTGSRAPLLRREALPEWGEPIDLLDDKLSEWLIPENNRFSMEEGILENAETGGNLISRQQFDDFKLHVEFRYPEGSNSGIYLRGRYEVQIEDNYGLPPDDLYIGGIYGFIEPSVNAAKKAGEWQTYDITLVGRMVNVWLNGVNVICDRPIPGITGGALDSDEGSPGPIILQGDHGPVEFRKIVITPAKK
ncbi:MAG: DUF1080 domain-containing protein [Balneolaceae bacterium]|nr:DUF1080 domain-containing protein [Balneolaceae bacterium]